MQMFLRRARLPHPSCTCSRGRSCRRCSEEWLLSNTTSSGLKLKLTRMGNKSSDGAGSSSTPVGRKLNDSVYVLSDPPQPQVEVVFIHGLQMGDFKDAYWKTWATREKPPYKSVCWLDTWLKASMPTARILSLSYDSRAVKSRDASGDIDMYSIGEALLMNMTMAKIGQNNIPVVFVCHSLGGLVAKQIVVHAWKNRGSSQQPAAKECARLLENMVGVFFYATPHSGSELADFADKVLNLIPVVDKSHVVDYLKVLCKDTALLNNAFDSVHRHQYNVRWKFQVIGESLKTKCGNFYRMVVPEASARLAGVQFMSVQENHVDVCKPQTPTDSSFLRLVDFIRDAVGPQLERKEIDIVDLT